MLRDRTEARQEGLRTLRVAKASHAPLALPCGLMAILRPVVDIGRSLDEHMLRVEQLRDVGFRRRIAAQSIGDDLAGHRVRTQHTLEEMFACGCDRVGDRDRRGAAQSTPVRLWQQC